MAKNETKRLKPALLQADKDSFAALQANDKYAPANPKYLLTALGSAHDDMGSSQKTETQTIAAAAAAHDDATGKEWEFHNLMLGAGSGPVWQGFKRSPGARPKEEVRV